MATINRKLADELIKGEGKTKQGTAGYVLVRYQNRSKYEIPNVDFFDPDAKVNVFDYAIFKNKKAYESFLRADTVGGVDILWGSEQFKKDEVKRQQDELNLELMEEFTDYIDPLDDLHFDRPGRHER